MSGNFLLRLDGADAGFVKSIDGGAIHADVWLASNFRLEIDGLDCTKVNAIDSFTVKQKAVLDTIGDARDFVKEPGRLEFPNLTITMAEVAASSWQAWFEDFVINGVNDEQHEKNGALIFLSPNRQTELGRVNFSISESSTSPWQKRTRPPSRSSASPRTSIASGWNCRRRSPHEETLIALERALPGWYAALQLVDPVEHDVHRP